MRTLVSSVLLALASSGVLAAAGQQKPDGLTMETRPRLVIPRLPPWEEPTAKRVGPLTLMPPTTRGEFVKVSVPIGELSAKVGKMISEARHRRAERRAREEVQRVIDELNASK